MKKILFAVGQEKKCASDFYQRFWHECALSKELVSWLHKQGFTPIWKKETPGWNANYLFVKTSLLKKLGCSYS